MPPSYDEDLKIGDRIAGRYEILAVLGHGSMGVVYKCRHDILGSIVAIKTLRLQRTADDRSQRRFEREARLAHKLQHPNLISVQDFGHTANGDPYLIMDFVSGEPLFDILKRERNIYPERVVNLFSQVCDGLYHAHQRGVIHRDLKPANMLVMKRDNAPETIKIVDLGVAKIVHGGDEEESEALTMTGEVCGSPIYLSPEQCTYQELDARTDIYSLGVCLYECLTGMAPLRGNTVYDTIYMHVHDMPRPFDVVAPHLEIPKRLEEIVFKCLAKQPKDRYETMMQLKHDLVASLKQSNGAPTLNVLPPELLFSGQNAAAKKASGEFAKPERKSSGEIPKPGKKLPGDLPRPGEQVQAPHAAQQAEEEEVTYRGKSRRQSAQQPAIAELAEPKKARTRAGKTEAKPVQPLIPASATAWGLGKWVMIGAAGSVVVGLSIGFGFAAFLSMNKPSTPTDSQMAQLPGQEFPDTSSASATKEPFTPSETFEVKPTPKANSPVKAAKSTSAAKKGQKPAVQVHKDLASFLPEEHLQDGSQNKFFSAIDMHGKGSPQMMPQQNFRNGARPLGASSSAALNSLVNRIPKNRIQDIKNF
ncbi:MAG: protein kinase, partial [Candidatus Obscuribacterales bacterium]|nr:protein kinase [Candidatus Obscuribacterales bacterium]